MNARGKGGGKGEGSGVSEMEKKDEREVSTLFWDLDLSGRYAVSVAPSDSSTFNPRCCGRVYLYRPGFLDSSFGFQSAPRHRSPFTRHAATPAIDCL
jgi:hypothetical protein